MGLEKDVEVATKSIEQQLKLKEDAEGVAKEEDAEDIAKEEDAEDVGKEEDAEDVAKEEDAEGIVKEEELPWDTCQNKSWMTSFPYDFGGAFCHLHRYRDHHQCDFEYTDYIASSRPPIDTTD